MTRQPTTEDKFSFGLWTVGWTGVDPFVPPSRTEHMAGVWDSAKACMATYLSLADKTRAFRDDSRVQEAMDYSGVFDLARPTLDEGESIEAFLAADDGFDPDKAAERDFGFVRLQQLALEHLLG